jgi:S1-C subfamily serine protease
MLAKLRIPLIALLGLFIFVSVVSAASSRVELTDGTVLVGEVKKSGNSYSIRMPDGSVKLVSAARIKTIDGKPIEANPAGGNAAGAGGAGAGAAAPAVGGSAPFQSTRGKADRMDQPVTAVDLWERFIAANPNSPDLDKAKAELAIWKKRYEEKAEKIKGKWIGGKELEDLQKKVNELVSKGLQQENDGQISNAIKSYEDALKLYPQSFLANFRYGYFIVFRGRVGEYDKAIGALETARKVDSSGPEVHANLAALYSIRKRHEDAIRSADKALRILNDPELVDQFQKVFGNAPRNIYYQNNKVRDIVDGLRPIIGNVGGDSGSVGENFHYFYPGYFDAKRAASGKAPTQDADDPNRTGPLWSGSGFFVSEDGYFITNHHVAAGAADKPVDPSLSFRVRLSTTDGTKGEEFPATLIAVDDKADIALMKIEFGDASRKAPYLRIAKENPPPASKVLVLGYPATAEQEKTLQVDDGSVKSVHPGSEYEVWFDLSTTHGNSGGPIVDSEGNVIGILTAGAQVYNVSYVYGVGPLQIKTFMDKLAGERSASELPNIKWVDRAANRPQFDGEKLAKDCTPMTVLVIAIRNEPAKPGAKAPDGKGPTTKPGEGDKPADGPAGTGGAATGTAKP